VSALIVRPVSQSNLVRAPLIAAEVTCLGQARPGMLALATSTPIAWIVVVTLIFGITLGTTSSANQTNALPPGHGEHRSASRRDCSGRSASSARSLPRR
jgi:hypothetical protein